MSVGVTGLRVVVQSPPGSPQGALFCVKLTTYSVQEMKPLRLFGLELITRHSAKDIVLVRPLITIYLLILYPKKFQTLVAEGPWLQMSQVIIMHQFVRVGFFVPPVACLTRVSDSACPQVHIKTSPISAIGHHSIT